MFGTFDHDGHLDHLQPPVPDAASIQRAEYKGINLPSAVSRPATASRMSDDSWTPLQGKKGSADTTPASLRVTINPAQPEGRAREAL